MEQYPLHLLNLASVHDVASRLPADAPPLGALRFRPNIICMPPHPFLPVCNPPSSHDQALLTSAVSGSPAYSEDAWKRIRIGASDFFVACRTARCRLPNTHPETGEKHAHEPDRTLRSFRCVDEGAGSIACLGMQMVPDLGRCGDVVVGDEVEVLERGEHWYIKQ